MHLLGLLRVVKLLKPTTDLVFKLLFQRDQQHVLLRSMLECVLEPPSPIEQIEIVNPDIEVEHPAHKPIVLDLRVKLKDLTRIDIEMQTDVVPSLRSRFLYYWARDYSAGLERGDDYARLIAVTSVIWLTENLLSGQQFHNVFHLSEDTTREHFCADIEFHTLELKKLHLLSVAEHPILSRWSRFLAAESIDELNRLAEEDPIMDTAKKTLEQLSQDPEVARRAYDRETALNGYHIILDGERRDALLKGKAEGRVEGRLEGQRDMVLRQMVKRFGSLPSWAEERIAQATSEQLELYLDAALTASSVEEVMHLNA